MNGCKVFNDIVCCRGSFGMNESIKKSRVQFLDIARGIAIICIILGHLNNSLINRVVFTFHVPIFFFITGYFMS